MEDKIKVSVIIRTCNRPSVLRTALDSIRKQTYHEIEVVVVEDGMNISEKMLKNEYSDLNIKYKASMKRIGRSAIGNIGLALASGEYCNFLDDDDIIYPKHIELLLNSLKNRPFVAAYGIAEESQIVKVRENPYIVKEKRKLVRYKQPYNRLLLYSFNYLPIQSVLFSKKLYNTLGGFNEKLDALEDWDLWVRYSTAGDFLFVPIITSKYFVPYRRKEKVTRGRNLDKALQEVSINFKKYQVNGNINEFQEEINYIINVYNQKRILYYLKQIWNYFVYGDR